MSLKSFLIAAAVALGAGSAAAQAPPPQDPAPAGEALAAPSGGAGGLGVFSATTQFTLEQVTATHLRLTGDVEMEGANLKLFADAVDYYTDTNRVVASGNVVFATPAGSIAADRVEFDAASGLGTFYEASGILALGPNADRTQFGSMEPEVYFYGDVIEKTGPRQYRLTRGGFSACVQPTPRWELTSGSMVLNLDEYAVARNTVLRVKGVPVFYLPIIYYPIQDDDRATGFLMPTYGTSTLRGQAVSNAFFWAIDRSQDATFFHDWFTRAGQGVGAEYRYVAGPRSSGNVRLYRFSQRESEFVDNGAVSVLPEQSSLELSGVVTQAIGTRLRAQGRLDYFSDVITQQLYHQDVYEASRRTRLIQGGISGSFGPLQTSALYQRNQVFSNERDSVLYGSTPRVSASLVPQRLFGSQVYASLASEFAYLPYRFLRDDVVSRDDSLLRVDIAPTLRVPLSRLSFLSVNTSAAYRTTYFSDSVGEAGSVEAVSFLRQYLNVRTEVIGPVFNRIFDTRTAFAERLKHVIEPTVTVDYTTTIDNQTRTPLLTDTADFVVGGATRLTYGLTNRFFARAPATGAAPGLTREFLTIGLQQTYYSKPESSQYDTAYASAFRGRDAVAFSPVALTARFSPGGAVDANARVEYDVDGGGLLVLTTGGRVSTGPASTSLSYSRRRSDPDRDADQYVSASTSLSLLNASTTGSYALSWDIARGYIVSQSVSATYMAQCCGLQVEFQNFSFPRNSGFPIPADRRFNVSVVLAGLGTFSNFFGAFGG